MLTKKNVAWDVAYLSYEPLKCIKLTRPRLRDDVTGSTKRGVATSADQGCWYLCSLNNVFFFFYFYKKMLLLLLL